MNTGEITTGTRPKNKTQSTQIRTETKLILLEHKQQMQVYQTIIAQEDYANTDKEEEKNLKHALEISHQEIEKERKFLQHKTQQLEQARAKTRISRLENPYDIYHKMKKPTNQTTNKMGVPRLTRHSS